MRRLICTGLGVAALGAGALAGMPAAAAPPESALAERTKCGGRLVAAHPIRHGGKRIGTVRLFRNDARGRRHCAKVTKAPRLRDRSTSRT
jgi:hypothetical protein